MDATRSKHTDREGHLIYRELPEVEYTGDSLLSSEINKPAVKKCVFLMICIVGCGQTAL